MLNLKSKKALKASLLGASNVIFSINGVYERKFL